MSISNEVYISRDMIKEQLINYAKSYLELEQIDLTKPSFLSYIINSMATLTSNLLFYQLSTHKEFFLTEAQLPENVINLAAYIGYTPSLAQYSTANVLVSIPLSFTEDTNFTITDGFKFKTKNDIVFTTYYDVVLDINNNNTEISIVLTETDDNNIQKTYNLPFDTTAEANIMSFVLPVRQYEIVEQEFQIDSDLPQYQFVTVDVPVSGKASSIIVEVTEPGQALPTTYDEYASLYLITGNGYVVRTTDEGIKLFFGNDLIGNQPAPGSVIKVTTNDTLGEDGNVISGSITEGDRLYTDGQLINYTSLNTTPALGGIDEESTEIIKRKAIANLVALDRLVSDTDFKNINDIIEGSPIAPNSLPILKRSDVKNNEIQLYTTLLFDGDEDGETEVVPSRNASIIIDATAVSVVERGTEVVDGDTTGILLFRLIPDLLNSSANYEYIAFEIEKVPNLEETKSTAYDLRASKVVASRVDTTDVAQFDLEIQTTETIDATTVPICNLIITTTGVTKAMTYDTTTGKFTVQFNYLEIPEDEVKYDFELISPTGTTLSTYSTSLVFRQTLNDFMQSNAVIDSTTGLMTIYDVPIIEKEYYESLNKRVFELNILQEMLTTMEFSNYKMMTDFINLKFTNTTGLLKSMQYNTATKIAVISKTESSVPVGAVNDRYIVSGLEGGIWTGETNNIAQCTDSTAQTWVFGIPNTDDIILVNTDSKKYIYTDIGWKLAEYSMPLDIEVHIFKESSYTGSIVDLANTVKTSLLSTFQSRFGTNTSLYRSEIITAVQNIDGIHHCRLVKPESSIFFDFDLDQLTTQQLLEYGPEYVSFTSDNITIKVL